MPMMAQTSPNASGIIRCRTSNFCETTPAGTTSKVAQSSYLLATHATHSANQNFLYPNRGRFMTYRYEQAETPTCASRRVPGWQMPSHAPLHPACTALTFCEKATTPSSSRPAATTRASPRVQTRFSSGRRLRARYPAEDCGSHWPRWRRCPSQRCIKYIRAGANTASCVSSVPPHVDFYNSATNMLEIPQGGVCEARCDVNRWLAGGTTNRYFIAGPSFETLDCDTYRVGPISQQLIPQGCYDFVGNNRIDGSALPAPERK